MKKNLILFHNSRCSKSRAVFEILENSKIPFEVVEYLKTPLTEKTLESILEQLGVEPESIVRKGEEEYESLKKNNTLPQTRKEWIQLMVSQPILIERPIVSDGKSAVVGRPPEKVTLWLNSK